MSAPSRTGVIRFGDASLHITEDPGRVERQWERQFKRDVFARVVQTLNRIGWTVGPWDQAKSYKSIALDYRTCRKGDLHGELRTCGRVVEFQMWQDVTPPDNQNGGRYDFDKERRAPYLLRMEMHRTRRRIRDYLCAVFDGYTFDDGDPVRGPAGLTAHEWVRQSERRGWHFDAADGRNRGSECSHNHKSADGNVVAHGADVYAVDHRGRMIRGTAHYNINNMWWVISGRYGLRNVASFEIYVHSPGDLRRKRNAERRKKRLAAEMDAAIKTMNFERAIVLRGVMLADEVQP